MYVCDLCLTQPCDEAGFDVVQNFGNTGLKVCFDAAIPGFLFSCRARDKIFIKRQVYIRQGYALGRFCQAPATGVPLIRAQQTCFAEFSEDAAYHHGICAGVTGDVRRGAHAARLTCHVAQGVQGQGQTAISLHRLFPFQRY